MAVHVHPHKEKQIWHVSIGLLLFLRVWAHTAPIIIHKHTQIHNGIIRQLSLPTEANLTDTSQNLKRLRNKANLTDTLQTLKLLRNKNKLTLTGLRVGCRMSSKGGNKSKTRLWGLLNLRTIGAISVIMVANKFLALSSFWCACL